MAASAALRSRAVLGRLRDRARAHTSVPLFRTAYGLMATTAVTSAAGLVFWVLAARLFSPEAVGRSSVLIASMMALSALCQLNLNSTLARFLPQVERPARALVLSYAATGGAALVVAGGFVLVAPAVSDHYDFLRDGGVGALFVIAVPLWCVFTLQDAALTALRRAQWLWIENGVFGVLRIGALLALTGAAVSDGLFVAWVLPMAILILPVNWLIFRRVVPAHLRSRPPGRSPLLLGSRTRLRSYLAWDFVGTTIAFATLSLLPMVVLAVVGSRDSAYFYIPFTLVSTFDLLVYGVSIAITVEGAFDERQASAIARRAVRNFARLFLPAVVVLIVAAPLLLRVFGEDYAREGTGVLRLFAAATLFRGVIFLYIALKRLEGKGLATAVCSSVDFVVLLGLCILLGPSMGLDGIGVAWFVSSALVAIAVAPSLVRTLRARWDDEP